ncbi:MAG: hypothetical protein OEX02_04290, partial [Cyclobacteriaceae bacterium]|nr:hypothetical protein [Cyclobacteriaceae bacterium]
HQWLGIIVALLAVALYLINSYLIIKPAWKKAYLSLFSTLIILVLLAGHWGGSLTHGKAYLTEYLPAPLRTITGIEKKNILTGLNHLNSIDKADIFNDMVQPILNDKCISCHSESKTKGDLQLNTAAKLFEGGENGPVIENGNAEKSNLFQLITLPEGDEDHMPPEGKRQLNHREINLLKWWINIGAPTEGIIESYEMPEEISTLFDVLISENKNRNPVYSMDFKMVDFETINKKNLSGISVRQIAKNTNLLQAKIQNFDQSPGELLAPVKTQLAWLDLSNSACSDNDLQGLADYSNITRLYLQNTEITDLGLTHIAQLPYLEYLNLYGTNITDQGLKQLEHCTHLRKLYLWNTATTPAGHTALENQLPEVHIITGNKMIIEK